MSAQILVISGSLRPESRSRLMARRALQTLQAGGVDGEWVDLRECDIPLCDGTAASKCGDVPRLRTAIDAAAGLIVAAPVYNFDVNAAVKNLVEQTGSAWSGKVVGFLCAAGGRASYMSIMGLANSLMLDFRCLIVPRFVYATGRDFDEDGTEVVALASDEVGQRVDELADEVARLAAAAAD